jgi:hypothetical protein
MALTAGLGDNGCMTDELVPMPRYTEQAKVAGKGVRMVDAAISDSLGWIFREQFRADVGIDAHAEIVRGGKGTGRLLALQIKCGLSWFNEKVDGGWLYRGEQKHLAYRTGHSLPVLVCICNPRTGYIFWAHVTESNVRRTPAGWRVRVPSSQSLDSEAAEALIRIANAPQHTDIIELLIPTYLQERYSRRIYVHPIFETPHDFHGLTYMTGLDNRIMFVDYIYAAIEELSKDAVDRRLKWRAYNERASRMGKTSLHVLVIGDSGDGVRVVDDLAAYMKSCRDTEFTRLIYDREPPFQLRQIDELGRSVFYGPGGDEMVFGQP